MSREERVLPYDLEAERSVLGAILVHPEALTDASELTAEQFFRGAHQMIFAQLVALSAAQTPIDGVTVKSALARAGKLEEVGGPAYLFGLSDGVPRSTNVEAYARIVREKSDLRRVITVANQMLAAAYDSDDDARTVVDDAERQLFELGHDGHSSGFVPMSEIVRQCWPTIEALVQTRGGVSGIASGFTDLDELTRGFQPSNLIILAARPSMGKTSLAITIAQHVADHGRTVGVFSLEMSQSELLIRQLCAVGRIDGQRLQRGYLGERDWGRLTQAMGHVSESRLHIDESASLGAYEMRARARRLKAQQGLDLLIVDYLQLMASHEKRAENRTLELGAISRALKGLAKELKIPVLAVSQLSRAPELRTEHRPMLSDLRESGALEQDADLVLFLFRESVYHETPENRNLAELSVAKHRNGPLGMVRLVWIPEETRFANLADRDEPDGCRQLPMGDRAQ